MKKLLAGINPWLPVFAFVTMFHIMRGSTVDAVIFGAGTLLLIADWKKLIPWSKPEHPKVSKPVALVVIGISVSILFFSERGGWQDVILLLALIPVAFVMVYYRDHGPKPGRTKQMVRSKWVWMALALSMAVSELFAYIWANVFKDDDTYPTISVIVNPILESPYGRAIFLTLWMLIGIGLLRIWRRK